MQREQSETESRIETREEVWKEAELPGEVRKARVSSLELVSRYK